MGVQRRPRKGSPQDKGQKPRWVGRYRDTAGKEYAKTFTTEKAAKAWVGEQERALRRGEWISPEDEATTLLDLAREWRDEATKPNTIANRTALVDNLGDLGGIPLGKIRPGHISDWTRTLLTGRPWKADKPLSASTVAVMTGQVSGLLNRAREDGLILRVPRISSPKAPPRLTISRQDLVTPQEVAQILEVATSGKKNRNGPPTPARPWLADMIWVALGSGGRISEICGLHPEDLDVLRGELSLVAQAEPGGRRRVGLKTEKPRTVPIPKEIARLLEKRIKDHEVGRKQPIFPYEGAAEDRVYHDRNSAGRALARVVDILGMRDITFHDFRHYYASVMIAQGASVAEVQAALGHATATTTLNTYTHLFGRHEDRTREAADVAINLVRAACGQIPSAVAGDELAAKRKARSGS